MLAERQELSVGGHGHQDRSQAGTQANRRPLYPHDLRNRPSSPRDAPEFWHLDLFIFTFRFISGRRQLDACEGAQLRVHSMVGMEQSRQLKSQMELIKKSILLVSSVLRVPWVFGKEDVNRLAGSDGQISV